ncbi:hypothetical protein Pelo_5171 [Pelomyxa schiedti]|nr:hypothetical protein Pelo_5171 [Pelomyxa schiedti]
MYSLIQMQLAMLLQPQLTPLFESSYSATGVSLDTMKYGKKQTHLCHAEIHRHLELILKFSYIMLSKPNTEFVQRWLVKFFNMEQAYLYEVHKPQSLLALQTQDPATELQIFFWLLRPKPFQMRLHKEFDHDMAQRQPQVFLP